jgi:hypothetical protein
MDCKCPKCKPEKYGWEVVALAKRDDCQELAELWDELNWQGYKMDDFERACCSAVGERKNPTYRRRECGPWSNSNEWGRRWCNKTRPDKKFVETIRECLDLKDLWGHLDEQWVYFQLSEAVVSKSSRDYQGIVDKVAEELENDSSSEDSESNWKDLDVNDKEDEISFQRRVDLRRVADRNARRKRHAARARKECEERERQERQERADRKREKERQERKKREREELDRKAAVKSKVYANAGAPPSKRTLKQDSRQSIEEEVRKMRTAEIKEELSKVGISYEGRGEIVAKLVQAIEEEVQKMSTAEIKGELSKRCISYEGRGELVAKLVQAREIQAASRGGGDAGANVPALDRDLRTAEAGLDRNLQHVLFAARLVTGGVCVCVCVCVLDWSWLLKP